MKIRISGPIACSLTCWSGAAALFALSVAGVIGNPQAASAAAKKAAKPAAKAPAGNKAAGAKLYTTKACSACHKLAGKGGTAGPDLSKEGGKHAAAWFAAFLKDPKSKNPKAKMPATQGSAKELGHLAAY